MPTETSSRERTGPTSVFGEDLPTERNEPLSVLDVLILIGERYGLRVHEVMRPVNPSKFNLDAAASADAVLKKLGLAAPYILVLGTLEPRTNLSNLVRTYL